MTKYRVTIAMNVVHVLEASTPDDAERMACASSVDDASEVEYLDVVVVPLPEAH
jgi:hypothetical protein